MPHALTNRTVLVTGATRGLGRALVDDALRRGAARVYATGRRPATETRERVLAVPLDVTDPVAVRALAAQIGKLDVLVNNAGISLPDVLGDRRSLDDHLAVNVFGVLDMTTAFAPHLIRTHGAVVNVLSLAALAPVPVLPAYAASKAAAASLTQSQRALFRASGVAVHGVYAGPIDTDMIRALAIPKTPADIVARAILDGVEAGTEDIFPDPLSAAATAGWADGTIKALERANQAMFDDLALRAG